MANDGKLRAVIEFITYDQSATDSSGKHLHLNICLFQRLPSTGKVVVN